MLFVDINFKAFRSHIDKCEKVATTLDSMITHTIRKRKIANIFEDVCDIAPYRKSMALKKRLNDLLQHVGYYQHFAALTTSEMDDVNKSVAYINYLMEYVDRLVRCYTLTETTEDKEWWKDK